MRILVACAIVLLILNSGDSQTRPRPATQPPPKRDAGRSPKAEAPIPGLPDVPAKDVAAVRAHLQKQLDEREQRQTQAARQAQRLRQQSASVSADDAAALLFHAGLLFLDAQRWAAAKDALQTVVDQHADSLWAQEARLCLFDVAFEVDLDPSGAAELLKPAVEWTRAVQPGPLPSGAQPIKIVDSSGRTGGSLPLQRPGPVFASADVGRTSESARALDSESTSTATGSAPNTVEPGNAEQSPGGPGGPPYEPRSASAVAADVHLRAGLLSWLAEDSSTTQRHFQEAFRFDRAPQSPINIVASAVLYRSPYAHTPPQAREGDEQIAQLILYADVLQNALQMYRAHRLWDDLLTKRSRDLSPLERSYIHFRRGHARYQFLSALERDPDAILKDYEQSRKLARDAPWADQSLLMAGNVASNLKHDATQAIELWQKVLDEYPGSGHAAQAAYFIGVIHERNREWEQAYLAFQDAQERYPDSSFHELIEKHLRTVRARLPGPPPNVEATRVPRRSRRGASPR
jgi:outer membrane protein assembly factor BamD (BamD/ComL family)